MPENKTDYMARLTKVQAEARTITAKRDNLNREAGAEERKVSEAYEQLHQLGIIKDASERLSLEQLQKLRDEAQDKLDTALVEIEAQVAEGNRLLSEYENPTPVVA